MSQIFGFFFKALSSKFCLLLERRCSLMSSSSQVWFPVNSKPSPVLLNADLHLHPCRQISITGCFIRWWRHLIPAVFSHASTSHPTLQDLQLLFLCSNWPEKELIPAAAEPALWVCWFLGPFMCIHRLTRWQAQQNRSLSNSLYSFF